MKKLMILMVFTAFCVSCMHFEKTGETNVLEEMSKVPQESIVLTISKDIDEVKEGKLYLKLDFKNVSNEKVYFPTKFRGGVTYLREHRSKMVNPGVKKVDEDGNVFFEGRTFQSGKNIVSRGCGGIGCKSKDDFVLLAPGESYSENVTIDVSNVKTPLTISLSRAIYSTDVKLPNIWLGNVKSNEVKFE